MPVTPKPHIFRLGSNLPKSGRLGYEIAQNTLGMVSVKTRNGIEIVSNRSTPVLEGGTPLLDKESDVRPPIGTPTGWRARYHSTVSFLSVLTFVFLSLVFILAHGKVADPDIWWHLHNAEYLIHHHSLPGSDMYSFTVLGYPWMNHEWLAELPYYFAWRVLGLGN
jgi:hypothetical protein